MNELKPKFEKRIGTIEHFDEDCFYWEVQVRLYYDTPYCWRLPHSHTGGSINSNYSWGVKETINGEAETRQEAIKALKVNGVDNA